MKLNRLMVCVGLAWTATAHAGWTSGTDLVPAWRESTEDLAYFRSPAENPPLWRSKLAVPAQPSGAAVGAGSMSRLNAVAYPNLWSFITSIRAQQQGRSFALLESHMTILKLVDAPAAGTVPLPAAGWLLVTGLMGLAAGRWKKKSKHGLACAPLQTRPAL
jgi:hypothetical protein